LQTFLDKITGGNQTTPGKPYRNTTEAGFIFSPNWLSGGMSYRSLGSDEVTLRNYRPVGRRKGNMSLSDPLAAGEVARPTMLYPRVVLLAEPIRREFFRF
jgi:hypothetical protein